MKKLYSLLSLVGIFSANAVLAQNISSKKWNDLFSFNNVLAVKKAGDRVVAATENGIFFYNPTSGEVSKLTKANGLHQVKISAFDYNESTQTGIIGYKDGSMDVFDKNGVTYIMDIPFATTYTGGKEIKHISITGNQAVISVGYGVSIFDVNRKEFGKTTYFTNGAGMYEGSREAVIKDNVVYALTPSGIKTQTITNTNFPVYTSWTTLDPGSFTQIKLGSNIMVSNTTTAYILNGTLTPISTTFQDIKDIEYNDGRYIVTDINRTHLIDASGMVVQSTTFGEVCNTANIVNNKIFGGSIHSGLKDEGLNSYKPDGPYYNTAYKINIFGDNQLLVSSGGRTDRYNGPLNNPENPGFYYYNGNEWIYSSFFKNADFQLNVMDAVANPLDPTEIFFTNYILSQTDRAIFKMKYDDASKDISLVKRYDITTLDMWTNRPVGLGFDENNNLFGTIAMFEGAKKSALAVYDKASDNFSLKQFVIQTDAHQTPVIRNGKLWLSLPRTNDFLVYNYNNSPLNFADDQETAITVNDGLPTNAAGTIASAFDKSGDLWIASDQGLRVLPNAEANYLINKTVEPIIIEQAGLGEELFRNSGVLQITVDEGNYKWISVDGGGVYYLSPDGQRVIKRFTKENSPLPTNSVTDIKVDPKTGKVYFATYEGIVTYQGDVGEVKSGFGNVLVYPNPVVQSTFKGLVTIKGLAEKTNIRITDAAGNLVHQAVARGGFYEWNLNNLRGKRVASGIYFVLMTNEDGSDKATAKIAVVN